jgi:hypothetical protein
MSHERFAVKSQKEIVGNSEMTIIRCDVNLNDVRTTEGVPRHLLQERRKANPGEHTTLRKSVGFNSAKLRILFKNNDGKCPATAERPITKHLDRRRDNNQLQRVTTAECCPIQSVQVTRRSHPEKFETMAITKSRASNSSDV